MPRSPAADVQRWNLAKTLFREAVRKEAVRRDEWLDRQCEGDAALRALIDRLLVCDDRSDDDIGRSVRRAAYSTACRIQARAKRSSS